MMKVKSLWQMPRGSSECFFFSSIILAIVSQAMLVRTMSTFGDLKQVLEMEKWEQSDWICDSMLGNVVTKRNFNEEEMRLFCFSFSSITSFGWKQRQLARILNYQRELHDLIPSIGERTRILLCFK